MSTIGPTSIVEMYMKDLFRPDAPPTPEEVERSISELVTSSPFFRHLVPMTREIVDDIQRRITVRIGTATALDNNEDHHEWLGTADRSGWRLWPRLERYLTSEKRYGVNVLAELAQSTDAALERLESPGRDDRWDRRGLVVGHVQSGKTTHYTALAAKALDAGYRIVIVLAGIHNNLRAQTQGRIDEYLVGRDSLDHRRTGVAEADWKRGLQFEDFEIQTNTTADDQGDFRSVDQKVWFAVGQGVRLVMVVKKNTHVLRAMTNWLNSLMAHGDGAQAVIPHPTLIIDDEADHASVNTADPDEDPTTINRLIRDLLLYFRRVSFVGYTATPFANIFSDPDSGYNDPHGPDLFPKSFILNLQKPSNYIGPDKVFGNPGDEAAGIAPSPPLPMHVAVTDSQTWVPDKHKKDHTPGALPASLREAVRLFLIATAIRHARGHAKFHSSMLVHATRFKIVQTRVKAQLEQELKDLTSLLTHGSDATRGDLLESLRGIWNLRLVEKHEAFRTALPDETGPMPAWEEIAAALQATASKFKVMAINGDSTDALAYTAAKDGLWVIAVGGDKLSRGLTLEGLAVSYFLRTSSMFDTLMQMGRWFGYRPGYADLCRVYTTPLLQSAFRQITLAFEELRDSFDEMARANRKPIDFGLKVRTPTDKLLITSGNKIRRGTNVDVRFAGEIPQALDLPWGASAGAAGNRRALNALVTALPAPVRAVRGVSSNHFLWHDVPAAKVLSFLASYSAENQPCYQMNAAKLREYITARAADGELGRWTVVVVAKSIARTDQRARIGGLETTLNLRTPDEPLNGLYRIGQLAGRDEETFDLSGDEFAAAQAACKATGKALPTRLAVREARPPQRGLMLIYPLTPFTDAEAPADMQEKYAVGACISFPTRLKGKSLRYTVNTIWQREQDPTGDWDDEGHAV